MTVQMNHQQRLAKIAEVAARWFREYRSDPFEAEEALQTILITAFGNNVEAARAMLDVDYSTALQFKERRVAITVTIPYVRGTLTLNITIKRDIFTPYWGIDNLWWGKIEAFGLKMEFDAVVDDSNNIMILEVYNTDQRVPNAAGTLVAPLYTRNLEELKDIAKTMFIRALQKTGVIEEN